MSGTKFVLTNTRAFESPVLEQNRRMTAGVAEYGAGMSAETQAVMDLAYKALNFERSPLFPPKSNLSGRDCASF